MRKPSLLKALTIVIGLVLVVVLLFQRNTTASPQPAEAVGRYQLFSGEISVPTRPGVMERRPVIIRIDTQSGNSWGYDSSLANKWRPINNP